MGKVRIKKIGFPEEEEKKKRKKKREPEKPKKTGKVPGLKGGERIKVVEGVVPVAEEKKAEEVKEEPKEVLKRPPKPRVRGRKYREAAQLVDRSKFYPLEEALELVKKTACAKFDSSVEAHFRLLPRFLGTKAVVAFPHPVRNERVEVKTESKSPVIHTSIGKVSFGRGKLRENLESLIKAIGEAKIKRLTLCATMGPGIKVEVASLEA